LSGEMLTADLRRTGRHALRSPEKATSRFNRFLQ